MPETTWHMCLSAIQPRSLDETVASQELHYVSELQLQARPQCKSRRHLQYEWALACRVTQVVDLESKLHAVLKEQDQAQAEHQEQLDKAKRLCVLLAASVDI